MKILISGASGFVGKAVTQHLRKQGHQVIPLARDLAGFEACEAIIHLAGEPIANERWSATKKKRILESRTLGSRRLLAEIESLSSQAPAILISASAIGFYGDQADQIVSESSPPGRGFLSEVCQQWEKETIGHQLPHTRQVALRIGMVLGQGGALEKITPIFKAGLGGPLGNGKQWMSWLHIFDLTSIIEFALKNEISGPVNAVSPNPITNRHFSAILAAALKTKSWLPAPTLALKIALGERAELLLSSSRVIPTQLIKAGFQFRYPSLDGALAQIFSDQKNRCR